MKRKDILEKIDNELRDKNGNISSMKLKKNKKIIDLLIPFTDFLSEDSCSVERIYCFIHNLKDTPKCPICGNSLSYAVRKKEYNKYCSLKCSGKGTREKIEETNLKRYGCKYPAQNKEVMKKMKNTMMEKYGVENISYKKEFLEKKKKTYVDRYGYECPLSDKGVQERIKQTNLKRYGVENPNQCEDIRKKSIETNLERYGCDVPTKCDKVKEKTKKTNLKKYGVEYHLQSEVVKGKIRNTNLEKYGVENPNQCGEIQKKREETNLKKYGVKNYAIKMQFDTFEKIGLIPLFNYSEYDGKNKNYDFRCKYCDSIINVKVNQPSSLRCPICNPVSTSKMERELQEFIESLGVSFDLHYRDYYDGKKCHEIDFYMGDNGIGIELNGNYWHSEISGEKDKYYHLRKYNFFKEKGIQIINIMENEWEYKKNIVKSLLRSKFGKFDRKIYARKCSIQEINSEQAEIFFNKTHLQGHTKGKLYIGLMYNNEIVQVCSFKKARFNKKYDWELLRFSSELNTNIVGGFSKILKYFVRNYSPVSIISYADKRISMGKVYESNGFEYLHESKPGYQYVHRSNYFNTMNRLQFQKHKLKDKLDSFDHKLTEWENMQNNGYDRIWDCGNYVYCYII